MKITYFLHGEGGAEILSPLQSKSPGGVILPLQLDREGFGQHFGSAVEHRKKSFFRSQTEEIFAF